MRLGFGWMGSKNRIAKDIVNLLPAGEVFVDLFAGGCAMTHAAMLSGKYKRFVANDIKGTAVFFKQAIEGKVESLYEWISREDFFARKDHDVKVAAAWSFGNTGDAYLYHRDKDEPMHLLFLALTSPKLRQRVSYHVQFIRCLVRLRKEVEVRKAKITKRQQEVVDISEYLRGELRRYLAESGRSRKDVERVTKSQMSKHWFGHSQWEFPTREMYEKIRTIIPALPEYNHWKDYLMVLQEHCNLQGLEDLESLAPFTQLQLSRLFAIEDLQVLAPYAPHLSVYETDYRQVPIPEGAVVYCDPPYANTHGYKVPFDSAAFWRWAAERPYPVFVSEYECGEGFAEIWNTSKRCTLGNCANAVQTTERLFVQTRFADRYTRREAELFSEAV